MLPFRLDNLNRTLGPWMIPKAMVRLYRVWISTTPLLHRTCDCFHAADMRRYHGTTWAIMH